MGWLFDRAMEYGISTPADPANPNHDLIDQDAIVIDVSVATAFWLERFDEGVSWSALPTFRPGAERVFLETAAPAAGARWGLAVRASDLEEREATLADALAALRQFERLRPNATLSTAIMDARWVLELHLIGEDGPRRPPRLFASGVLVVRPDELPAAARFASAPAADRSAGGLARHAAIVAGVLGAVLFGHACLQAEPEFGRETILLSTDWERRRAKQAGMAPAARHAVLRPKPLHTSPRHA